MIGADLFAHAEPAIRWNDEGLAGVTRDGRAVTLEQSPLSARWIASVALPGYRDLATRRSCVSLEAARAAAERIATETP